MIVRHKRILCLALNMMSCFTAVCINGSSVLTESCIFYSQIGCSQNLHEDAASSTSPSGQGHQVVRLLVVHSKEFGRREIRWWITRYDQRFQNFY